MRDPVAFVSSLVALLLVAVAGTAAPERVKPAAQNHAKADRDRQQHDDDPVHDKREAGHYSCSFSIFFSI